MCQEIYIKEKVYSGVLGKGTEVIMKGLERERERRVYRDEKAEYT